MKESHDLLSNWYDFFASVASFGCIYESQAALVPLFPRVCPRILIPGCGNGKFLSLLLSEVEFETVTVIDSSAVMLENTQNLCSQWGEKVDFIHSRLENYSLESDYDLICTPFFLDLFSEAECIKTMQHLYKALRNGGYWFCADFSLKDLHGSKRILASAYIRFLYEVFAITAGLKNKELPAVFENFERIGMDLVAEDFFMCSIIHSAIYKKDLP